MNTPSERHQCEGISKKTGERCTALAVKDGKLCAGHAGLGVGAGAEAARAAQQKAAANRRRQAEQAKKSAIQVYRDGLERDAAEFYERKLQIVRTGNDADALKAMDALETRALGRPTEHVQTEDVTLRPEEMGMAELLRELRKHAQSTN